MKYKLLGRSGLRVSELCLGTMTFGTEWGYGADHEESKRQFDAFLNAGGNFIDTADIYTKGTSEKYLSEFAKAERDNLVLATKYTFNTSPDHLNTGGNHRKNMIQSLEASLERMNLEYVDLFWVHAWDFTVRPQEMMRWLEDVVKSGMALHIGISDTPAWIMATCNTISELRGWEAFSAIQVEYSLLQRTPERDLLPMAKDFDMAVTAWSPLAAGLLTGKYINNENKDGELRVKNDSIRMKTRNKTVEQLVVDIAKENNAEPANVALAWIMQRDNSYIPIIGARSAAQVEGNLVACDLKLSADDMQRLDDASAIDLGFPHDFLKVAAGNILGNKADDMVL